MKAKPILMLLATSLLLVACGGGGSDSAAPAAAPPPPPPMIRISWTANREAAVNSAGGGYKIHYSSTAGFSVPASNVIDVPFVSGTAPTSANVTLASGRYYFKVVAYSALNTSGSAPSTEATVLVP